MNTVQFWLKASDIITIYRSKYRHAILTDDEQIWNVSEFLANMDALALEWYNSESKKEKVSNDNKINS